MSGQRITKLLRAADAARRAGSKDVAARHWRDLLALAPSHPVALNALGAQALERGDVPTALDLFRRAVAADPTSPDLWFNLARVQQLAGDEAGQAESLERSVALAPRALAPNIRLAELLQQTGADSAAAERWTTAIAITRETGELPTAAQETLRRGHAFLAERSRKLGEEVDRALAAARGAMDAPARRRVDAAIDYTLGRRPIYFNKCSGLHVPFLPADEFFDDARFPWFATLAAATDGLVAELGAALGGTGEGALASGFSPYVDLPTGVAPAQWGPLDKSVDWSALHLWRDGVRDDAVCARFPRAAALLELLPLARLPGRMPTVFFSALKPGTHIPPHTGVTNARAIVHLPLIVPQGCRFRVGGETREWRVGQPFAFDDTIEHEAWNDDQSLRVVLIMDAWNPHLTPAERELIAAFYTATERSAVAPSAAERRRLG